VILYDKESNLLGMSKNVLDFLGYEDLEEFKTFTNDVADLFEQRSGYVYRFKNFSWINYVLHSGAPNKNAILRLKSNKEVEVRILIEEIFLIESTGNEGFYKVDLQPVQGHQPKSFSLDKIPRASTFDSNEPSPEPLPASKEFLSVNEESTFLPQEPLFEDPTHEIFQDDPIAKERAQEPETSIQLDPTLSFMDQPDFSISSNKTKEEPKPLPVTFDEPFDNHASLEQDEANFTKIDFQDEAEAETSARIDEELSLANETQAEDESPKEPSQDMDYDPTKTLDDLGLEPNELKLFLHEYCDHIEMVSIALEDAIIEHDTEAKHALLMQLKGTDQHLRIDKVNSLLEKLTYEDDMESLQALQSYARNLKTLPIGN